MNKELKSLIDQYCMGMKPTEAQEIEIFDKVAETGADIKEVSSYMTEMQNGPTKEERLAAEEAERKAKEEAERKAAEEAERIAKEKAEKAAKAKAERESKKEAERKAKEEAERKAKEIAEKEAKAKAEREDKKEAKAEKESVAPSKFAPKTESKKRTVEHKVPAKKSATKTTESIQEDSKEVKKSHLSDYVIGGILALLLLYALYCNVIVPMLK